MSYPVPRPIRFPVMHQGWCELTFLHWRYPAEAVQAVVPRPLEVESFDGSAWVGVVPFILEGLRPALMPPLPWLSRFPETNCRTYVRAPNGSSGVWFFSLDAARWPAVAGGRLGYGLPYAWSRMRVVKDGRRVAYECRRRWPDSRAFTDIQIEPGDPIEAGELEIFLTPRYRLYSFILGRLACADVEHAPWPLYSAVAISARQNLTEVAGLPQPRDAPIVHFSPGVQVRVGRPLRV